MVPHMIGIYYLCAQAPGAGMRWARIGALKPQWGADIGSAGSRRVRVTTIYKICERQSWLAAEAAGEFRGSADDRRDGFIHFSAAGQLAGTVAKHFAKQSDLVLIAVDAGRLGPHLKWERSRGDALFPHLYGPLRFDAVRWVRPLPDEIGGRRQLPELEAEPQS
jgi:uncharacterized protein (DUF952 family)